MIIPSIDISQGKAVQLRQGAEKVLEKEYPKTLANEFSRFGEIALIDLDSAKGKGNNQTMIHDICRSTPCRVGGGLRSIENAVQTIRNGAEKVIIGTKAFHNDSLNHSFLKKLKAAIGKDRIIVAIDSWKGNIVTNGWAQKTGINIFKPLKELEEFASEILYTCVDREGLMQGSDISTIQTLRKKTGIPITAAGGISSLEEISILSSLDINCQLGMALYTGKITLSDAFIASLKWENTLIPTITMDTSSRILMLAYSNQGSLHKTFETNKVWYYSRSRQKLWKKGESSGNLQHFQSIRTDCDGDTLLFTVEQEGKACHKGSYSCFRNPRFSLLELYEVIRKRLEVPSPASYTARLSKEKIREKILEEAEELTFASKSNDIIWEAADLVYFILVILAKNGIQWEEVLNELKNRRRIKGEYLHRKTVRRNNEKDFF